MTSASEWLEPEFNSGLLKATSAANDRATLYLPSIGTAPEPTAPSLGESLFDLLKTNTFQMRPFMIRHHLLDVAAQRRADDMLARRWFGHVDPDGVWPNDYVRREGYELPEWYLPGRNNVESIALNYRTATEVMMAWHGSFLHRRHMFATDPFFQAQTQIGIGVAWGEEDKGVYVVFVSAPPEVNSASK